MRLTLKILFILGISIVNIFAGEININKKLHEVKQENKQIMFFFHIPRCPYCTRMLKENFKDKEILEQIKKNFILIDIYTKDNRTVKFNDFKGTQKEFANYIGIKAFPSTLFMNQKGEVIHKAIGYRNIQEHLIDIKYISTKSYNKIDLETFAIDLEMSEDD